MSSNPKSSSDPQKEPSDPRLTPDEVTGTGPRTNRTWTGSETRGYFDDSGGDTLDLVVELRRKPVLIVLEGKGAGEQFLLQHENTTIGREMDVEVVLRDGRVSRKHSRIRWENPDREIEEPRCIIEDLESRNGTIVNGQKINDVLLHDGDRILIGGVLLGYYIKDEQELGLDQRLIKMATTDTLTGLANRLFFESEARREIDRAHRYKRPLSLLLLDLDHFKATNDTYGHAAGDTVLRQFARLLLVTVRQGDVLGRLGGEEFGALLPETPLDGAIRTAERIRERTEKRAFRHKEQEIQVTVSVGVAQFSPIYQSRSEFFEATDKVLYQAKQTGRNRVCHAKPVDSDHMPDTDVSRKSE